jgi:hypothetical protein
MPNGRIADFEVYVEDELVATGTWPDGVGRHEVRFETVVRGRRLRLVALSEVNGNAFASLAELELILASR